MKNFFFASSNSHKAQELTDLFNGVIEFLPSPLKLEVDENGDTFRANALLKAEAYFRALKKPVVSDDSGLVIEERPDLLGVQSARYAPDKPEYFEKCIKLLEELKNLEDSKRKAHFVCYLCFYLSPEEIYFFEGRVHGVIARVIKGDGGFGYDPIFIPDRDEKDGKTLAELENWKKSFSHRAKAAQSGLAFFQHFSKLPQIGV
jgi:XTP/dITP diphosphohydrolase